MATDGTVLVHGGLHTASCWDLVTPLLDGPLRAVDLPGRGARPADLSTVTLDDCVDAVISEADAAGFERFALVGHSLGGVTITETAFRHPQRVTHLVYVAALVPVPGSSAAILYAGADMESMDMLSEGEARALFGNDLTDSQWAAHWQTLVPDAVGIMNGRVSGHASGIPTTYIGMAQDVAVPPEQAEEMAANLGAAVRRRTIDAGHTVMVSKPGELAALINEAVAG